ncbi:MAG: ABC transporter substrate-binding protein [Xanthobacteraceae bacterium]|nr:ABC transporter substrate-binding protein [Xanthobacteraceae bacterium]
MAIVDLMRLTRSAASLSLCMPSLCMSLLVAFFVGFPGPIAARAETAIHFTLDRKIDGPAAPFFLAIDKGYFKDEGLDVTIDAATGGPLEAMNRVAAGSDDMGVADINMLIKARDAANTSIKALFIVFDKPPYAIIARKSRGIETPRSLEGKKLGAPAADPAFAQWPVFARINGIDTAKVTIENVGLPVREPMLASGEVDAITGCAFTSYIDLKARGVPADDLVVLAMADYGLVLYGDAIMVSDSFAQAKPEAVRGFLRAYLRALKETVRNPARAIDALLAHDDRFRKDVELERLRMALADNILTPAVRAYGYGDIDPQRFAAAIEQLALAYRFKAKDKAAAAFDPSFLPPAAERGTGGAASR